MDYFTQLSISMGVSRQSQEYEESQGQEHVAAEENIDALSIENNCLSLYSAAPAHLRVPDLGHKVKFPIHTRMAQKFPYTPGWFTQNIWQII